MISRLDRLQGRDIYENTALAKINELVDAINNQQIQLNNHECRLLDLHSRITALDDPTYHEEPDENVQERMIGCTTLDIPESYKADPYAEQRKWIGKVCKVYDDNGIVHYAVLEKIWDNSDYCYGTLVGDYQHCEPVSPEDDIIYKGE